MLCQFCRGRGAVLTSYEMRQMELCGTVGEHEGGVVWMLKAFPKLLSADETDKYIVSRAVWWDWWTILMMTTRKKMMRMMGRVKRTLCHLRRSPDWAPKDALLSQPVLCSDSFSVWTSHKNDQTCKQFELMNEKSPRWLRVAKRGVDCGHIQSLLRQAHFIQVPIMKPGDRNSLRCERNMWQLGEKRRRQTDRHRNQTPFDQLEFGSKGNGV